MNPGFDLAVVRDFATALLIGALIGIEREKRRDAENHGIGGPPHLHPDCGIGAIAGYLSQPVGCALDAAGRARRRHASSWPPATCAKPTWRPGAVGLTTEVAALVTCLLGGLATLGYQGLAIGLGVVTAATLAYKQPLHGLVAKLGWDDVFAGLRLLLATFIVLPLLPDRAVDPWGALNPHTLWLLVLLIAGLSLVGYIATRWLGPTGAPR